VAVVVEVAGGHRLAHGLVGELAEEVGVEVRGGALARPRAEHHVHHAGPRGLACRVGLGDEHVGMAVAVEVAADMELPAEAAVAELAGHGSVRDARQGGAARRDGPGEEVHDAPVDGGALGAVRADDEVVLAVAVDVRHPGGVAGEVAVGRAGERRVRRARGAVGGEGTGEGELRGV